MWVYLCSSANTAPTKVVITTIQPATITTKSPAYEPPPNHHGNPRVALIIPNPTTNETTIPVTHAIKFNTLDLVFFLAIFHLFENLFIYLSYIGNSIYIIFYFFK